MRAWRDTYSFAAVVLVIGLVSATAIVSCGSGGGETNGELCQQCGDSDGPCISGTVQITGRLPEFCEGATPCPAVLLCTRKVDSGQRRCFPADPDSGNLDFFYECDGSRPALVPTATSTRTPTPTATAATPTSTAPTPSATSVTPTATPTAPPGPAEVAVDITIAADVDETNELPASFSATVTYPPAKGSFVADGAPDCDPEDGVTFGDTGSGTLTITFEALDPTDLPTSVDPACIFHQTAGEPLTNGDLGKQINPDTLLITIVEPAP